MYDDIEPRAPRGREAFAAYCAEQRRICEADFQSAMFETTLEEPLSVNVLRVPQTPDPLDHPDSTIFYVGQK